MCEALDVDEDSVNIGTSAGIAESQDPLAWLRQFCWGQGRNKKERKTYEEMRRKHQIMNKNRVWRFPEGIERHGKVVRHRCT